MHCTMCSCCANSRPVKTLSQLPAGIYSDFSLFQLLVVKSHILILKCHIALSQNGPSFVHTNKSMTASSILATNISTTANTAFQEPGEALPTAHLHLPLSFLDEPRHACYRATQPYLRSSR
jgi:hypothetical protein